MDASDVTGDEPIVVVNRHTGKTIKRQRAPVLNDLAQFLAMNPAFDVDIKWSALVRQVVSGAGSGTGSDKWLVGPEVVQGQTSG